jgi:hypothetical protein
MDPVSARQLVLVGPQKSWVLAAPELKQGQRGGAILNILHSNFFNIGGASKIKLKKVNKKRTVTVRRVFIFWNISRHPLLI